MTFRVVTAVVIGASTAVACMPQNPALTAGMPQFHDVEVVPPPAGMQLGGGTPGEGFYCFEYKKPGYEAATRCSRTVESCRAAADDEAKPVGGVTSNVGTCAKQASAFCSHLWLPSTEADRCYRSMDDCKHDEGGKSPTTTKMTACAEYK